MKRVYSLHPPRWNDTQDGQLGIVQHRAVAVAALHRVAPGLDDAPLLVAEVVLLYGVEVAVLQTVPEDDDRPVLHHGGGVARAVTPGTAQCSQTARLSVKSNIKLFGLRFS